MLVVGDETGLLKVVGENHNLFSFGEQNRSNGVVDICADDDDSQCFSVLRVNGMLERWQVDIEQSMPVLRLLKSSSTTLDKPLTILNGKKSVHSCAIVVGSDGRVMLHDRKALSSIGEYNVSSPLSAAYSFGSHFVVGGKEADAEIFDIASGESSWKAKNVPNDKLNLRVPIWITCFDGLTSPSDTFKFVTGTAYKHVRLYDTKAGNRPTLSYDIDTQYAITSIKMSKDEKSFYVADGGGNLFEHDISTGRRLHTLKGCTGALRDVILTKDGNSLISVGLDRYLRAFDCKTGKSATKVYMKCRLNSVAELQCGFSDLTGEDNGSESNDDDEEPSEDQFSELESDFSDDDDAQVKKKKKRN